MNDIFKNYVNKDFHLISLDDWVKLYYFERKHHYNETLFNQQLLTEIPVNIAVSLYEKSSNFAEWIQKCFKNNISFFNEKNKDLINCLLKDPSFSRKLDDYNIQDIVSIMYRLKSDKDLIQKFVPKLFKYNIEQQFSKFTIFQIINLTKEFKEIEHLFTEDIIWRYYECFNKGLNNFFQEEDSFALASEITKQCHLENHVIHNQILNKNMRLIVDSNNSYTLNYYTHNYFLKYINSWHPQANELILNLYNDLKECFILLKQNHLTVKDQEFLFIKFLENKYLTGNEGFYEKFGLDKNNTISTSQLNNDFIQILFGIMSSFLDKKDSYNILIESDKKFWMEVIQFMELEKKISINYLKTIVVDLLGETEGRQWLLNNFQQLTSVNILNSLNDVIDHGILETDQRYFALELLKTKEDLVTYVFKNVSTFELRTMEEANLLCNHMALTSKQTFQFRHLVLTDFKNDKPLTLMHYLSFIQIATAEENPLELMNNIRKECGRSIPTTYRDSDGNKHSLDNRKDRLLCFLLGNDLYSQYMTTYQCTLQFLGNTNLDEHKNQAHYQALLSVVLKVQPDIINNTSNKITDNELKINL